MKSIPVRFFEDHNSLSSYAADLIVERCENKPGLTLGLATGYSPTLTYQYVAKLSNSQKELLGAISIVQLDEWVGTRPEEAASCHNYIANHVIGPWQLSPEQYILLNGDPLYASEEAENLKVHLSSNKLDLCILGLGRNGHLALNEPGSHKTDRARIVELDPMSQRHPMISLKEEAPEQGITIGLAEIMESKEIILLITGEEKRNPFQKHLLKLYGHLAG